MKCDGTSALTGVEGHACLFCHHIQGTEYRIIDQHAIAKQVH